MELLIKYGKFDYCKIKGRKRINNKSRAIIENNTILEEVHKNMDE